MIGVYASASRQKHDRAARRRHDRATALGAGSRLGEPLINEVIIPIGKKDYWNATDPADERSS